MANLQDNIRVSTQVDMQQLDDLILKYKDLKVNVTNVAAAARAMAEIQKAEIRSILAAEQVAENERDGRSERRRLNKIANIKTETQSELDAIKITDAASKAKYNEEIRSIALYNAQMKQKALETRNAQNSSNGLFNSLNSLTKIRSELITLFGAYSIGSFAQAMVEAQSKVESFQLSMKNLLGDAYGTKLTNDLKIFTVNTPLNFEEVIQATNTLVGSFKAAGASSKTIGTEIPQILESLGNSAAALGGENRLGRLIYAFSQVQATGRLMGTEVRQITETGFPLLSVMSERSGKSVQQLQKDISDGKVSFEQFKEAILSAGKEGGVFAGSMDIMANTVRGRIDKMKEQVFFALANIGNQFNDSAKRAIDFSADIVQALFGTESATKRTIDVIKTSITTWIAYQGAVKLAASQTVIATAIDRASLIIRGQMVLANISLTGSTESFTFAQLRAAAAARSFNTVAASNPLGLLVLAIGAVTAGYQIYSASVDEAIEKQNKLSSDIASAVAPIKTQKQEFNNLANAVLSTTLPIEEQTRQLNRLKLEYPQLLKGVQDLSTAEKILNENKIKTNITFDYRNEKLNQLKAKYPEQLKGIDNLSEAEDKLAGVVRIVNRDFAILSATMENNVRLQNQVAGANENFAKKIKAQAELAKLMAGQTGSSLVDFGGNILDNSKSLIEAKQKEIKGYDDSAKAFVKSAEVIRAENQRLTDKLVYNYNEIPKVIESTGKEGKEKALKYQNDTDKQKAILQEANSLREQQETRDNQQKILDLEKEYAELRVNNAKGSQTQKVKALLEIETKYNKDKADLTREWDKRDLETSKKFWDNIKKEEEEGQKDRIKFSEAIDRILLDSQESKEKESLKIIERNNKEKLDLDEKNSKESLRLLDKKYELMDNLKLLERVSQAKDSDEIVKIQKEENLKILSEIKEASRQQFIYAKLRLEYIKQTLGEESLEYSKQKNITLKLEEDFTDASINLEKEKTKQVEAETKKREEITKEAFSVIYQIGKNVLNDVFSIKEEKIKNELGKASSELDKFRVEQKLKDLETEKSTIGFFTSLASGDWVQAVGNLISVIRDLGRDTTFERQAALLKDQLNSLKEIMGIIDNNLNSIGSSFESIKNVYGSLFDTQKLSQFTDFSEKSIEDRIALEIKNGEQIVKNYETAASKENDLYNKKVKSIEDSYNLDIDRINKKYDLIDLRANQAYTRETLSILSNGSTQLEALIKNEESLSSVREELAAKRLAIENSFPLASKQIVEGMSQAEIDAINESIKARDEALSKLQKWYNDELTFIVNNEGQKRKQYSETEKIQLSIQENLDLAAIKFKADEIQREKDKADEIVVAQKNKNEQILIAQKELNDKLVMLEQEKNSAILMSYMNLQLLVQAQVYQITGALVDSANLSAEAFAKLKQQLEEITNLYRVLTGGNLPLPITVPPFNIPVIPFEKGTDNTSISLSGQPIVDNRGGKPAILHPDEAVFSKANMSEMTKALGYRPSRDEVIEKFKMGIVNMKLSHSPYVIPKLEAKGIGNVDKVVSELKSVANEMRRIQTPQVIMNERGIKTYLIGVNSKVQAKLDRFK